MPTLSDFSSPAATQPSDRYLDMFRDLVSVAPNVQVLIDGAVHRTRVSLGRGERAFGYLRLNNVGLAENIDSQKPEAAELRKCGGCADDFARKLGADVAITGEIQKVSNLILNINVYVKDLKAGPPDRAYSVDIRDDNDTSFEHGVKYLVKNNLPPPEAERETG